MTAEKAPPKFAVMRHPVFQEDEGRSYLIKVFASRAEADAWIAAQTDTFYKPSDYFVLQEQEP